MDGTETPLTELEQKENELVSFVISIPFDKWTYSGGELYTSINNIKIRIEAINYPHLWLHIRHHDGDYQILRGFKGGFRNYYEGLWSYINEKSSENGKRESQLSKILSDLKK